MREMSKGAGRSITQPSSLEEIAEIEELSNSEPHEDYRDFLLEYSISGFVQEIGDSYFPCRLKNRSVIESNFTLVPWETLTIAAMKALHNPHPSFESVGPRVQKELFPLARENNATFLIDPRPDRFTSCPSSRKGPSVYRDMPGTTSATSRLASTISSRNWAPRTS